MAGLLGQKEAGRPKSFGLWLHSHSTWITTEGPVPLMELSHYDVLQTSGRVTVHTWREPEQSLRFGRSSARSGTLPVALADSVILSLDGLGAGRSGRMGTMD